MSNTETKSKNPAFSGIFGQPVPTRVLSELISRNRLPGTLLFSGPGGTGKLATALAVAKLLHCADGSPEACECSSCRAIRTGNHPEIMVISRDRKIGIDDMREIVSLAGLKSSVGQERVIIIDRAENASHVSWNAALKTLEEPGDHVRFILITDTPAKLLSTVRSRSYKVRFGLVPDEAFTEFTKAIGDDPDSEVVRAAMKYSAGRPGIYLRATHYGEYRSTIEEVESWFFSTVQSGNGRSVTAAIEWKEQFWSHAEQLSEIERKSDLPRGGDAWEIARHFKDPKKYPVNPANFRLESASGKKARFWGQGRKALLLAGSLRRLLSLEKTPRNAALTESLQDFVQKVGFNCSFDIALERLYFNLAGL